MLLYSLTYIIILICKVQQCVRVIGGITVSW